MCSCLICLGPYCSRETLGWHVFDNQRPRQLKVSVSIQVSSARKLHPGTETWRVWASSKNMQSWKFHVLTVVLKVPYLLNEHRPPMFVHVFVWLFVCLFGNKRAFNLCHGLERKLPQFAHGLNSAHVPRHVQVLATHSTRTARFNVDFGTWNNFLGCSSRTITCKPIG